MLNRIRPSSDVVLLPYRTKFEKSAASESNIWIKFGKAVKLCRQRFNRRVYKLYECIFDPAGRIMVYGVCVMNVFSKTWKNMAAWKSHPNSITPTSVLGKEVVSNEETSADYGIPLLAGCADQSDQKEAITDESEVSRKSSAEKWNARKNPVKIFIYQHFSSSSRVRSWTQCKCQLRKFTARIKTSAAIILVRSQVQATSI